MDKFKKDKEVVAPLLEKILVNLPPNQRSGPDTEILLNFLNSTKHFLDTDVLHQLFIDAVSSGNEKMLEVLVTAPPPKGEGF